MKKQPYFNLLTSEGSDEATMLVYGYIGDYRDYYTGEQKGVTDIEFVQELERLAAQYNTIHVRINSPGGEIFHGSAIVTAIRNCKAEVNTWIDGVAASMAGVIWMAGKKRHMAKNAMLMIHSASGICWGNAAEMREMAETLAAFDQSLITSAADSLGVAEEDMRKKYFDGKDHWLTWNDVNAEGWLSLAADDDDYKAAAVLPQDITNMNYRDLVAWFEKEKSPQAQEPGFLTKVKAFFEETAALFGGNHIPSPINTLEMNLEDFKKSIKDKTLDIEAVKAFLAEQSAPPAAPAAEPAPNAELEALKAEVAKLTELVAQYGAKPGASKSTPDMPANDLPVNVGEDNIEARMKKTAEFYAQAAANNEVAQFVIGQ